MTTIRYSDGEAVQTGDHVSYKSRLFWQGWRPARISYVPGVSQPHPEMEHDGLAWVGVSGEDGTFRGILVDPETHTISRSVKFVRRSDGTSYLTPEQIKPDEW